MEYRYKKRQIFRKKLEIPKHILSKVYNRILSFREFIEYELADKIPITCLEEPYRFVVEKFGVEKAKTLDWDLLAKLMFPISDFKESLAGVDASVEDLNISLYESAKDKLMPKDYSPRMKEIYKDRLFEISQDDDENLNYEKIRFNMGNTSFGDLVSNWDLYKDKDLSYCLRKNGYNITNDQLKESMNKFEKIYRLIVDYNYIAQYEIVDLLNDTKNELEQKEYIKRIADEILEKRMHYQDGELSNNEYKELFKYSSITVKDYLESFVKIKYSSYLDYLNPIFKELAIYPQDYIFDIPIPFDALNNMDVLRFISVYGLKNVVDFDNECGHFFTKNNCQMLKLMYESYLHYTGKETFHTKTANNKMKQDENGNHVDRLYTKDEFYEAMKRMIINGPTNSAYHDVASYYRYITGEFRIRNAQLFISEQAPEELQKLFYTKNITLQLLVEHPEYVPYLSGKSLSFCFGSRDITLQVGDQVYKKNIYDFIGEKTDINSAISFIAEYSNVFDIIFKREDTFRYLDKVTFFKEDGIDEIQRKIDELFSELMINRVIKYSEDVPKRFKEKYPTLFLNQNVSQDIRNKFYNQALTLNDFIDNPKLLDVFGNTDITYGFTGDIVWVKTLFDKLDDLKMANYKRLKVMLAFSKIQDFTLKNYFKEYVIKFSNSIDIENVEYVSEVLSRLSSSNASEMYIFREEIATQVLQSSNPIKKISEIEDIFVKNNIPIVGKVYSCFEILHPNFQGFNFDDSMISPTLKKLSTSGKKIVIFSDLIKSSFGSNNRSVNSYLKNIEVGSKLYESIKSGQIQYDSLDGTQKEELIIFRKHLATLYNNTMRGKKDDEVFADTGNVLDDILELSKKLSPDGTLNYNLADRVVRMFCGFARIDTLQQAKNYINQKIRTADARNRSASSSEMLLEQGDFVKGIKDITYLRNILQNGSVSKEYLGSDATSDATPLDTDVSMITESDGTTKEKLDKTVAKRYGPIWLVLKNDDRFITTRTSSENIDVKSDISKMEVFYTGVVGSGHYGIRTGFASSEINYIIIESYDPRIGLEIAMNGFYIPVANKEGQIVFTPNDYDKLRKKMSGLSHYDENNYTFSENLVSEETDYIASQIEQSNYETQIKRTKINEIIKEALEEVGLYLKTNIDGDLTEKFVELIDTGSTGRGTNKPGDGDFDFIMRLDRITLSNPLKQVELKQALLKKLGKENSTEITSTGDLRLKGVKIDPSVDVDIDITFTERTDGISYSTDMALQDRLATIRKTNPEKYKYVVANIILAKQVLKQAEAYKPNRGETAQGGLGGVGIENWILQNGGSFIDAATSFIEESNGKSFEEFKANYQIWDFGDNHLAERRGKYSHDNFIGNNMSEAGYYKMVQALKEYMKNHTKIQSGVINGFDSMKR